MDNKTFLLQRCAVGKLNMTYSTKVWIQVTETYKCLCVNLDCCSAVAVICRPWPWTDCLSDPWSCRWCCRCTRHGGTSRSTTNTSTLSWPTPYVSWGIRTIVLPDYRFPANFVIRSAVFINGSPILPFPTKFAGNDFAAFGILMLWLHVYIYIFRDTFMLMYRDNACKATVNTMIMFYPKKTDILSWFVLFCSVSFYSVFPTWKVDLSSKASFTA